MPAQQGVGAGRTQSGTGRAVTIARPAQARAGLAGRLEAEQVRAMFDRVAGVYDLMNTAMTAGLHHRWRERAAELARVGPGSRVLDVATGTGDLALELARRVSPGGEVVGCDFAEGMLARARAKAARARRDSTRAPAASSGAMPWRSPTRMTPSTPPRSASARATSPIFPAVWRRWRASCAPAAGWWCWRSRRPREPRCRSSTGSGSTGSCPLLGRLAGSIAATVARLRGATADGRDRRRLYLPAQLGQALSRPGRACKPSWSGRDLSEIAYLLTAGGIVAIHAGTVRAERA